MITTILLAWAIVLLLFALAVGRGKAHFNTPKPNPLKAEAVLLEFIPSQVSVDAAIQMYERQIAREGIEATNLPEGWDG